MKRAHVLCVIFMAAVSAGAAGSFADGAAAATLDGGASITAQLGTATLLPGHDSAGSGQAEAFRVVAPTDGTVASLTVFVGSATSAPQVRLGLYTDAGGHPGTIVTAASIDSPTLGAWNTVSAPTATVSSGTTYWLAILGAGGSVAFRDRCCGYGGPAPSETSAETTLQALPSTWSSGTRYHDGPMSAYATIAGTVPTVAIGDGVVEPWIDTNAAGQAEAFQQTAGATGLVKHVDVYLDPDSTAAALKVGIYSDASGSPGTLLSSGTLESPTAGGWNEVAVAPLDLAQGTGYWLALLAPVGAIRFRDHCCGGSGTSASQTSLGATLTALPQTWQTGASYHDGGVSMYAQIEPPVTLTVATAGDGAGRIQSADGAVDCSATCSVAYPAGSFVELTAAAADGSLFTGWTQDCSGVAACRPDLTRDSQVTAMFVRSGELDVTVSDLPDGVAGDISVDGPAGYHSHVTTTTTLANLLPGDYTITASDVPYNGDDYEATTATQDVAVTEGLAAAATVDYYTVVSQATQVVQPLAISSADGSPDTGETLTLPDSVVSNLTIGDIIVAGVGPETPDGLLATVTSISGTTVTTTPAALTDAVPRGDVTLDADLTAADVATTPPDSATDVNGEADASATPLFDPADPATTDSAPPSLRTFGLARTQGRGPRSVNSRRDVSLGSLFHSLVRNVHCGASAGISLGGSVSISPHITFQSHWGGFLLHHLDSATLGVSATEAATVQASGDAGVHCSIGKTGLLNSPLKLRPFTIMIGALPVVVVPRIQFFVSASASLDAHVDTSITHQFSQSAGITYSNGRFSTFHSLSRSSNYQSPSFTKGGDLNAQAGVEVSALIYGIAGPEVDLNAGLDARADLGATPWWKLTGSLNAGASLTAPALKLSSGRLTAFNGSWILAQAAGSAPDTTPPSMPVGLQVSGVTQSGATLGWLASSGAPAGYDVYVNGGRVAGTGATSYAFGGLACGTSYTLGVVAVDAAGNRSAMATTGVTTSACTSSGGGDSGGTGGTSGGGAPTVTLSEGAHTVVSGCTSSACAFMVVSIANFAAGSHTVQCFSDDPFPFSTAAWYTYTTSSFPSAVCVYGYPGYHAWVKVDGVESNHVTW